ncbi:MAG: ribosome biogenesis GTPase Der [Myxococcota bacterium]
MDTQHRIPIIAIVGRPNVGKSTLFNRFAGHRRALVEDSPGITRDRIAESVEVAGRTVLVVDTAGLDPAGQGELESAVQTQAREAVEGADAILFVVDGKAGLLPEDQAIARTLRRTQRPLAVAVNKIDVPAHNERVTEFYSLGLEPLVATSAEHGGGAWDVLEWLVEALPEPPPEATGPEEEGGPLRVAFAGRPNVGKSSLVNRLLGQERVVVSDVPGTTRDAIDTPFESDGQRYVLIDTAGLRRPGRRTRTAERGSALMTVRSIERAQLVLLVLDSEEGFTDQDAAVARLVRDQGRAAVVLANKWDRVPGERGPEVLDAIRHGLRFMSDTPILTVSALTGAHLSRVWPTVAQVMKSAEQRIPTADLNRWLEDTVRRHEPSLARKGQKRRRPLKFFYATQTGVRPPTFVLFCTDPRAIQTSYRRFLENRLREAFGFEGTPVRIRLRARSERA